jgi:hypothetical protein
MTRNGDFTVQLGVGGLCVLAKEEATERLHVFLPNSHGAGHVHHQARLRIRLATGERRDIPIEQCDLDLSSIAPPNGPVTFPGVLDLGVLQTRLRPDLRDGVRPDVALARIRLPYVGGARSWPRPKWDLGGTCEARALHLEWTLEGVTADRLRACSSANSPLLPDLAEGGSGVVDIFIVYEPTGPDPYPHSTDNDHFRPLYRLMNDPDQPLPRYCDIGPRFPSYKCILASASFP